MREELDIFLAAIPFVPFQITLASGQVCIVRNAGLVNVGRDIAYIMHPNSDHHSVIRLVQIAAIDTID